MYEQTLTRAGLDEQQALVYEILLKEGILSAGEIHKRTPFKRGLVYKVLDELTALSVIEKKQETGKVTLFTLAHPLKLKDMAEKKEREAKDAKMALDGVLPAMISDFNLYSGKPGVRFYEGKEGVWEVLEDSLRTKGEMYTYTDMEAIDTHIRDINEKYAKKRDALGIEKKVILLDTPYARERMKTYHRFVTNTRFIAIESAPFQSALEIYDDKVAYITFHKEMMMGVIIQDASINAMHRSLFEYAWKTAQSIGPVSADAENIETPFLSKTA